ncbi:hypothetical protein RRG08_020207 [Elysia crispata]|uniref:Uncharacterized protein n=1 Tax=Elysia crispata TaxID=231223 RepID=A0AAE1A411_9GAST|nr:hypothetical protein RRG08_020207 [Elysia crispata]
MAKIGGLRTRSKRSSRYLSNLCTSLAQTASNKLSRCSERLGALEDATRPGLSYMVATHREGWPSVSVASQNRHANYRMILSLLQRFIYFVAN